MALKRQITDLKEDVRAKDEELLNLKRDIRNTKYAEYEAENNILMNECVRLRTVIDQLLAEMKKPTVDESTPENGSPSRHEKSKDDMIQNLLQANQQFQKVDQEKDHRIMELQQIVQDLDQKFNKKNSALNDAKRNHAKTIKGKNREIQKLRSQLDGVHKDGNLNRSTDNKVTANKENSAKNDKEVTRLRGDLKKFKEECQKAKQKILELQQVNDNQLDENKELKRKINDYKGKIELFKKREENAQSDAHRTSNKDSRASNISSFQQQEQFSSHAPEHHKVKSEQPLNSLPPKDMPDMKPIVSENSQSDPKLGEDDFNFDDVNYANDTSNMQNESHVIQNEKPLGQENKHEEDDEKESDSQLKIQSDEYDEPEHQQYDQEDQEEHDQDEYGAFEYNQQKQEDLQEKFEPQKHEKSDEDDDNYSEQNDLQQDSAKEKGQKIDHDDEQASEDEDDYGQDEFENLKSPKDDKIDEKQNNNQDNPDDEDIAEKESEKLYQHAQDKDSDFDKPEPSPVVDDQQPKTTQHLNESPKVESEDEDIEKNNQEYDEYQDNDFEQQETNQDQQEDEMQPGQEDIMQSEQPDIMQQDQIESMNEQQEYNDQQDFGQQNDFITQQDIENDEDQVPEQPEMQPNQDRK